MWKVQTGERAPLWCTLIVFTQADGECFMSHIIVHQAKEYSQDLHFNTRLEWIVNYTPYGYMDRYRWLKSITQFSNVYGTSPVNNEIIFFGGHASHFDDPALRQMKCQNIQPFVIKTGDSTNDQTNDNATNYKLKSLYNEVKAA